MIRTRCATRAWTVFEPHPTFELGAFLIADVGDGVSNRRIGELVGMHFNQVGIGRQRFESDRLAGLLDGDRPGRPPTYGDDDVLFASRSWNDD